MSKYDIINILATEKFIENNITWVINDDDKKDLCQIIYVYLLEMDDYKFFDIFNRNKLKNYIMSMITIQFTGKDSKFNNQIVKFRKKSDILSYIHLEYTHPK